MTNDTSKIGTPDQLGLEIARAVQRAVHPATVILYGSRAVGEHRTDSDVDLLTIAGDQRKAESAAAQAG